MLVIVKCEMEKGKTFPNFGAGEGNVIWQIRPKMINMDWVAVMWGNYAGCLKLCKYFCFFFINTIVFTILI